MNRLSTVPSKALVDKKLTDSERVTLGVLASHANATTDGWCYPSMNTLAEQRGLTRRSIINHLNKLRDLGYVRSMERTRSDGGQTSNLYKIMYLDAEDPPPDKLSPPSEIEDFTPPVKPGFHSIKDKQSKDNTDSSSQNFVTKKQQANGKQVADFFGTEKGDSKPTESTAEKESPNGDGPTRNSRQQALHELESLFCKLTNLKPPPRKTKKQQRAAGARWWSPLGTIYSHLAEEDLDQAKRILTIATTRMKTDGLTISAPQSIEQVANAVYAEISQQPKVSVGEGGSYVF